MKVGAVIVARMRSSRLPGKSMVSIEGKPSLWYVIERTKRSKRLDDIIVATSKNEEDKVIMDLAKECNVKAFAGSEDDVLGRVVEAGRKIDADAIALVNGDTPFFDSTILDRVIDAFVKSGVDYASINMGRETPQGYNTEVFDAKKMAEYAATVSDKFVREHSTLYFYEHPEKYKILYVKMPENIKHPEFRVTLDTAEDLELIRKVYAGLKDEHGLFFGLDKVVEFLIKNPEIAAINQGIKQKGARG